jgi:glycosyltransferase involved in cell wall biosynthesis
MSLVPKISIITPAFNQGPFIEATIRSVINQEYPNLEYMILDGGSSDETVSIIKKYARHITYWHSKPDRGQADAINQGLKMATGDILAWLNSDDLYAADAFQLLASYHHHHPDVGCIVGDLGFIDASGHPLYVRKAIPFHFKTALYGGAMVPQPATFFTRAALQRSGLLNESLHYLLDYEFFLRMYVAGVRFGLLQKKLADFRLHEESKTVREYHQHFWLDQQSIILKYKSFRWCRPENQPKLFRSLRTLYRLRAYAVRSLTRGDWRPFQVTAIRKKAA